MTLVAGIGNGWRGDDAAGLAVARALARDMPEGVMVVELDGAASELIELLGDAERAFLVDAVRSGSPPGTVHRLAGSAGMPAGMSWGSTHSLGVAEAIELVRRLGRLPDEVVVYGIEGERYELGFGLSGPVRQAVEVVAGELRSAIAA